MPSADLSTLDIRIDRVPAQALGTDRLALSVLRADLLDPLISGNKLFKLYYNLEQARAASQDTLLSFGGPWSNHLHALAVAGKRYGFNTIGVIRGELPEPLNPCLVDARRYGMTLHPVSRSAYAGKEDTEFIRDLQRRYGRFHLIPEGGANLQGLRGCAEIAKYIDCDSFDYICLACGTGTTLAGLATATSCSLLGFQVLKGPGYLQTRVQDMLSAQQVVSRSKWRIFDQYHWGGYARVTPELMNLITDFETLSSIPLEPVYSGKLISGILDLIKRDFFPQNSRILAIHGGGLQGKRGFV